MMAKNFAKLLIAGAVFTSAMGLGVLGLKGHVVSQASAGDAQAVVSLKVDNFRLTDQNLESHELDRLADANAIVLLTQQNGCPVSRNTGSSMKALVAAYAGKGVEFMMLNSNPQDTREEIAAEAKAYGYDVPILMDTTQLVGEQLNVTRTAEAIVIDPKTMKVVYRGPIDDRVTYERQRAKANHNWAKDALDAFLAGKPIAVSNQKAVGCLINFPERNNAAPLQISYVKQIAPIIQEKCVACHQSGGIGPMPLTSYQRIKSYAPMIREVIRTQRMPPWRADPSVGKFHDDKGLTPEQTRDLVHWIEAGAPRGEEADPIAAITYQAAEWPLGKPDLILDVPAYDIPASGIVDYQRPFILNPLKDGRWLRASTIKVENRQAVHHILTGYMTAPPEPGAPANESRWGVSVGGYAVGAESIAQPEDTGAYMPPGGAIGFQNHYTPFGQAVTERSKIALYFYDKTPTLVMHNSVIANPNISIPPNVESWKQQAYLTFPKDALLFGAFPHAHYRGASSQLWIRYPDGKEKLLLALPHYDFNWQRDYAFQEPIAVPAGSKLIAIYTYDNSKRNPANPDPSRTVPWGDQSFDEMLYTALRYRWVGETSDKMNNYDALLNGDRFFGILDTNMDDKLQTTELVGRMGTQMAANFALIDTNKDGVLDRPELTVVQEIMRKARRQSAPAAAPSTH